MYVVPKLMDAFRYHVNTTLLSSALEFSFVAMGSACQHQRRRSAFQAQLKPHLGGYLDPVHTTQFSNENDTVLFRIRLPSTLQRRKRSAKTGGSIRICSPEWNDLKRVLFESAVFLVWAATTVLSENDDVTTTTRPGCRPLNREWDRRFQVASLLIAVIFSL